MEDEPATEQQLNYLRHLGCAPEARITKKQALELIRQTREHPRTMGAPPSSGFTPETRMEAFRLRQAVERARRTAAVPVGAAAVTNSGTEIISVDANPPDLAVATTARQEFWLDTCREARHMRNPCPQVLELYQKYGCRCFTPTHGQTQEILDALDTAFPFWDRDHPEFFYQTLELNFPDTVRLR